MADPVSIGLTVALTAAQYAANASRRIDGPRLTELGVSTADYGTPVFYFHGQRMTACPIIWAEKRKEVIQRRKTKGGKTSNAIYFGTWAVLVAGHPCDAVQRISMNKQLAYDTTGAGPLTPFAIGYSTVSKSGRPRERTVNLLDHMRIYYGDEDQLPDPRMQATIDAEFGPGSTSAYRGVTIIVFEDVPLEKFGNQVPTVEVLATRNAVPAFPYETFPTSIGNQRLWNTSFSPDGAYLLWASATQFELWYLPTRTRVRAGSWPVEITPGNRIGVYNDGSFLAVANNHQDLVRFTADGVVGAIETDIFPNILFDQRWQAEVWVLADGGGAEHWMTVPYSTVDYYFVDGTEFPVTAGRPTGYFADLDGNIWGCFTGKAGGTTTAMLKKVISVSGDPGETVAIAGLSASVGTLNATVQAYHYRDAAHDHFVIAWRTNSLHIIDRATGAITATQAGVALDVYNVAKQFANIVPGAMSLWANATEVSSVDLSVLRTISLNDWLVQDADGVLYSEILGALLCWPQFLSVMTIRYLDRPGSGAVDFAVIANDVADQCGQPVEVRDFSALTQPVRGYGWTQGSGKDVIEPLRELLDVDFRPHDFVLQGVERGGAAGATIASDDFARIDREDAAFSAPTDGDTDLPRLIRMTFADANADHQVNAALAPRLSGGSGAVRAQAIDMSSLVLTPSEAQQYAERLLRRRIFDRQSLPIALTGQYGAIEPADVRELTLDGHPMTARLISQSIEADGSIATEWKRDDPSVHVLSGSVGAEQDGWVPPQMFIPVPARAVIADVPLAVDAHDSATPFLYYAAGPTTTGVWTGADFEISDTTLATDFEGPWASVASSDAMDWGYVNGTLPDALPWVFDRGTQLNIVVPSGTVLTSVTEVDLLDDGGLNLLLIGAEYIQFVTATLQGDGSYIVTDLLRGCRGTEAAIAAHAAGETMVVVDSRLYRREVGAGEIGDTDAYRATTRGTDPVSSPTIAIAFGAAAQRPYAPVHGVLALDTGSGDWSIAATRRTRVGGANVDGGDVPLGEASEAWVADIMDGDTVVRTIGGTALPLTYSAADQTTDWGAPQTDLTVNLYQVSPALGLRGFPLALAA